LEGSILRVFCFEEFRLLRCDALLLRSVLQLLVTANVVPSSLIPFTLMIEAIRFSETSVLTRTASRHIAKDAIPHSHRRENLKSDIALTGWAL
jgi:hypothetical protein